MKLCLRCWEVTSRREMLPWQRWRHENELRCWNDVGTDADVNNAAVDRADGDVLRSTVTRPSAAQA